MHVLKYPTLVRGSAAPIAALRRVWRLLSSDLVSLTALVFLLVVAFTAIFAAQISPYGPNEQNISARLLPPSWAGGTSAHFLGTDGLGRDVLARILYGTRMALLIPLVGIAISLSIGVILGLTAGYYGGKADAIIMRLVDVKMAFSSKLLLMVIIVMLGPGVKTIMLVFGLTQWVIYARVVRGALLSLREAPFVQAARVIGCSNRRVVFAHIMPNLVAVIISLAVLEMAGLMASEAGLSFLGFGVQPPTITWGLMLAAGQEYLTVAWWVVTFPGVIMSLTVLAFSLVGIWLRAATNPFQRHLLRREPR